MFPLTVITWRLGKFDSEAIEPYIIKDEMKDQILLDLSREHSGIFYLATCQRILLVTNSSNELVASNLYLNFLRLLGLNPKYSVEPEFFYGIDALHHLTTVISSLDSVVLGEVQIQGQFKQAFRQQEHFLDKSLKKILSQIIRTGKRVRDRSLLKNERISTISLVKDLIDPDLTSTTSIGLVGTGKMATGILKFMPSDQYNIDVYSRSESRVGTKLSGKEILSFDKFTPHQILILATDTPHPIITKSCVQSYDYDKIIIVDLGMPRNCDTKVTELPHVSLISMEDLVMISKNRLNKVEIESAYSVLDKEIKQIISDFRRYEKTKAVVSLRKNLLEAAESRKNEFNNGDPHYDRKFDQFINQLIHVSQQHLEELILEKHN
ncbi:MAG: hypothetical protein ACXADH_01540 [Candidatus Kariarchaeaceae archaeon]|jgi:glutamyl-tRNA reductase